MSLRALDSYRTGRLSLDWRGVVWHHPLPRRDDDVDDLAAPAPTRLGPLERLRDAPRGCEAELEELQALDSAHQLRAEARAVYYSGLGDPARW